MWCANNFDFPLNKDDFDRSLSEVSTRCGDSPYVATSDDGKVEGFFCYSVDASTNEGMFKYVMVDPLLRGQGIGSKMLRLALENASKMTHVDSVMLNVFTENLPAKKCYENAGFTERKTDANVFKFNDESWGRCNMVKVF